MRILAIRGANLASLAEPFDLDLTAEPLAGTGLFAITGDTGAGKSTILDALCLALYGTYPRTSDRRHEDVRDVSGETLQASDARNILRRGAASASAEVDFLGADGIEYRATWAVRRARGKAAGRLQNVERKLERRDGSAAVATGARDVNEAVVARTNFTFDEFRRAVLLAQGEFDALLLADEPRRAELLEKITGTDIYSRISVRVYEETAARQRALEDAERRRDAIGIMDEAARLALTEERDRQATELAALDGDIERIGGELKRAEDIARARASLEAAKAQLSAAAEAWQGAQEERARAGRLEAVLPLRPLHEARTDWMRRHDAAHTQAAAAAQAVATANARLEKATATCDQRRTEARDAARAVEDFEPAWQEAAELDAKVTGARSERDAAHEAAANARDALGQSESALTALRDRRRDGEARHIAAQTALAGRAAHAPLADDRRRLTALLDKRQAAAGRAAELAEKITSATFERTALQRRLADAAARLETAVAQRAETARVLDDRRQALRAIDAAGLEDRDERLRLLLSALVTCGEAARRRDEAREAVASLSTRIADLAAPQRREAAAVAEAEKTHGAAAAARQEAGRMADLAEATLSRQAEHLRSALVEGEPCPVCGSAHHPFADDHGAAGALAFELRRNRAERDRQLGEATTALTQASKALAATTAALQQAQSNREDAARRSAEATAELQDMRPRIVRLLEAAGAPETLHQGDLPTRADVARAEQWAGQERSAIGEPRRRAAALAGECEQLQKRHDTLGHTIETERAASAGEQARLADLQAELRGLESSRDEIMARLAENLEDLAPFLAGAELTGADIDRDGSAARRRLERLGDDYAAARDAHERTARELAGIADEMAKASQHRDMAASADGSAERQLGERRRQLEALEQQRAPLLGGEATEVHRARARAAAKQAQEILDAAQAQADERRHQRTELALAEASARQTRDEADREQAKAAANWTAALAQAGLGADDATALLAVADAERRGLLEHVDRLRSARVAAETTLRTREQDLADTLAAGPEPAEDGVGTLQQRLRQQGEARDARRQRQGAIDSELARDAAARAQADEAGQGIAALRDELSVWQDVDAAIGQRDGAKFRRFAQGVTLGHLVALANVQLAALNPRYRLARGAVSDLAIDVIDRDMGGEARPPRSLSGGERFLVSLALALALSGLEGRQSFVDTLFIDEGFGALDREALDTAIDVLESLQGRGRKVGVITHVPAMMERIAVQVRVVKRGGGRSVVRIRGAVQELPDAAPAAMQERLAD